MILLDRRGDAAIAALDGLGRDDCVERLERALLLRTGRSAVATSSVDGALHAALWILGARRGDNVFVPTYTFYSYAATVADMGCVPVFIDCDPQTRCVSASALEAALVWAWVQDRLPRAVIIDNAFGSVADFDRLTPLCKAWNVPTVELAADALCGEYKGTPCGANCDMGVLAFGKVAFGGGGALLCDSDEKEKALAFCRRAYTDGESHDYRMHPSLAALDLASLDTAARLTVRARANLAALCARSNKLVQPVPGDAAAYALCRAADRMADLRAAGFNVKLPPLVHTLARYNGAPFFEHERGYPVCLSFSDHCLVSMDISIFQRARLIGLLSDQSVT